ncbi:flavodoxin family protein [Mastigocoleus sp. MO_188.B34]|uniref:flavodoxin family protein n=1 Tax=Mastigocoleus sp. MO_188.B34 TaxID=3036635 RepID=UPI002624B22E|nr:flavodoxin family protein [Mastigocoleus sp. MO_188.B34]MDJ0696707.1 flavodoxin family protein [Mastigocoleus sp. MO_188.B34]
MNALVVYYSEFGNTKQVADAIAQTCRASGSVREISADKLEASDVNNVDLLVFGTPTHMANQPKALSLVLEDLPKGILKGVRVAAFDTSFNMNWFVNLFTAAKPLNRKLRQLGGKQIVPPKSFFVADKQGPLCKGEIERAKNWAKNILTQYKCFPDPKQVT